MESQNRKDIPEQLFLCGICRNISIDPVYCRQNKDIFCRACIISHLTNEESCPICKNELTTETLVELPELMKCLLSERKMNCKYFERGCKDVVLYQSMKRHVEECDYAPISCSNEGCVEVVSKRDIRYHEEEVCRFRKTRCSDCTQLEIKVKQLEEMMNRNQKEVCQKQQSIEDTVTESKAAITESQAAISQNQTKIRRNQQQLHATKQSYTNDQKVMKNEMQTMTKIQAAIWHNQATIGESQQQFVANQNGLVKEHEQQRVAINTQLQNLVKVTEDVCKHQKQLESAMKTELSAVNKKIKNIEEKNEGERRNIIIAGGRPGKNTVEIFNNAEMKWIPMKSMKEERYGATSFIYNQQLFVCGGLNTTKKIERLRTSVDDILNEEWFDSAIDFPHNLSFHCTEVYNDKVLIIGGVDNNKKAWNSIWQVQLQPPHNKKRLIQMPEPRFGHGSILIKDNIFIFGGRDSLPGGNILNSVIVYNITGNTLHHLAALPYAVARMAVVKYKESIIVIGGLNEDEGVLNKVLKYNTVSGRTDYLPEMSTKRYACSAVMIKNEIFVMGGKDDKGKPLNTVEVFNFDLCSWTELPSMNEARFTATAVVI